MAMTSNAPSTVSIGISHDCQRLLHSFVETESVRYDQFASLWRKMNFTLLRCGLKDKVDEKIFLEETFQVVTAFFLPPYGFQVRVGALYLLYAFFYTQTHTPRIKIRVTLKQWQSVRAFHDEVRKQNHYDVEYVFRRLRMDKAFLFVAMPTKVIPSRSVRTGDDEKDSTLDQPSVLSDVLEGESLEQMDNLHTEYQRMKCIISGSDVPSRSLDMVPESMAVVISKIIGEHEEWRKKRREARCGKKKMVTRGTEDSDSDAEWEPEDASSSRKRKIAEIKKNAYSNVGKASRSRRYRQQKTESAKKSPTKRKGRSRRKGKIEGSSTDREASSQNEVETQEISSTKEPAEVSESQESNLSMPVLFIEEPEVNEGHDGKKESRRSPAKKRKPTKSSKREQRKRK